MAILLVCLSIEIKAQELGPKELQQKVQQAIAKVSPACVFLSDYDTITKREGGNRFSGVIVSEDGLILTAAHVGHPKQTYLVIMPDGKECFATGLGSISKYDVAVLKMNQPGNYPYAEMGWASSLRVGEPCFSVAYPGSMPVPVSVARFGMVADLNDPRMKMIRTTCRMEPGDSGGPVFDLLGRVIGIRSYILMDLADNFEVPVDTFRKYWSAFQKPVEYNKIPIPVAIPKDPLAMDRIYYKNIHSVETMTVDYESKFALHTVELINTLGKQVALGLLVKSPGHLTTKTLIVSKSSEIPNDVYALLPDATKRKLKVEYRDEARDLVLLSSSKEWEGSLEISSITSDTVNSSQIGMFLLSPNPRDGGEFSVLGSSEFGIPGTYNIGYFGAGIWPKDGHIKVKMIENGSPANKAGLLAGDQLVSINKVVVNEPQDFINVIRSGRPGDTVHIAVERAGTEKTFAVVLSKLPEPPSWHAADQFKDGKSDRRDGFERVFAHDGKLKPSVCGGPVFNLDGVFMGINIARVSRTSSVTIPSSEVKSFLEEAIKI